MFVITVLSMGYFIIIAQTTKLFMTDPEDLDMIVNLLCAGDIPITVALIKVLVVRYNSEGKQFFKNEVWEYYEFLIWIK